MVPVSGNSPNINPIPSPNIRSNATPNKPTVHAKKLEGSVYHAKPARQGITSYEAITQAVEEWNDKADPDGKFDLNDKNFSLKVNGKFEQKDGSYGGGEAVADTYTSVGGVDYFKFNLIWFIDAKDAGGVAQMVVRQDVFTNVMVPSSQADMDDALRRAYKLAKSFELVQKVAIADAGADYDFDNQFDAKTIRDKTSLTFSQVFQKDAKGTEVEGKELNLDGRVLPLSFFNEDLVRADLAAQQIFTRMDKMETVKVFLRSNLNTAATQSSSSTVPKSPRIASQNVPSSSQKPSSRLTQNNSQIDSDAEDDSRVQDSDDDSDSRVQDSDDESDTRVQDSDDDSDSGIEINTEKLNSTLSIDNRLQEIEKILTELKLLLQFPEEQIALETAKELKDIQKQIAEITTQIEAITAQQSSFKDFENEAYLNLAKKKQGLNREREQLEKNLPQLQAKMPTIQSVGTAPFTSAWPKNMTQIRKLYAKWESAEKDIEKDAAGLFDSDQNAEAAKQASDNLSKIKPMDEYFRLNDLLYNQFKLLQAKELNEAQKQRREKCNQEWLDLARVFKKFIDSGIQ